MANYLRDAIRYQQEMEEANRPVTVNSLMARKAAAMKQNAPAKNMLTQYAQKPADPLESFRSLAGLRDAYERRVQPIINNVRQTFSTGGAMGDLLRSYGEAAAPGNAAALQGMGIPFKGPMTAPREEGFSSGENFRPMGDPQQQFAGQLLGDPMNVQPMIAPAARGVVAAGKYAGPELARGLEKYMVRTGGILPMDVYHGSPHRFPPTAKNPLGEFDASKIGTGEGAQAYGHGLYFAENPAVAQDYARVLTKNAAFEGKPVYEIDTATMGRRQTEVRGQTIIGRDARGPLPGSWRVKELADEYKGPIAALKDLIDKGLVPKKSTKWIDPDSGNINVSSVAPNVYKVDLPDEQIAKMLDWDKPLSQQSAEVQKAVLALDPGQSLSATGASAYGDIRAMLDSANNAPSVSMAEASKKLRQIGIPGIRYLDGGSRAGGQGTSNFVVFPGNEGLLKILDRK